MAGYLWKMVVLGPPHLSLPTVGRCILCVTTGRKIRIKINLIIFQYVTSLTKRTSRTLIQSHVHKHTFIRVCLLVATQSTATACCPINDDEAQAHYHKQHAQSSKTSSLREKREKHFQSLIK